MKLDQPTTISPDAEKTADSTRTGQRYLTAQNGASPTGELIPRWFQWCLCLAILLVSAALFYRVWRFHAPGRAIEIRSITASWSDDATSNSLSFAPDDFQLFEALQTNKATGPGIFTELLRANDREDYRDFFANLQHRLQQHETLVLYLQAPAVVHRDAIAGSPDIELLSSGTSPSSASRGYSLTELLTELGQLIEVEGKVNRIFLILDLSQFQGDLRLGLPENHLTAGVGDFLKTCFKQPKAWHPGISMLCQTETGPPVWINSQRAYSLFAIKVAYALQGGSATQRVSGQPGGYVMASDLLSFLTGSPDIISGQKMMRTVDGSTMWVASPRIGDDFRISAVHLDFALGDLITRPEPASSAKTISAASTESTTNGGTASPSPRGPPALVDDREVTVSQIEAAWKRRKTLRAHLSVVQQPTRWSALHHWLLRAERLLISGFPASSQRILSEQVTPLLGYIEDTIRQTSDPLNRGAKTSADALALLQQGNSLTPAARQARRELLDNPGDLLSPELELLLTADIQAIRAQWSTSEIRAVEGDTNRQLRELGSALAKLEGLQARAPAISQQLGRVQQYFLLFPFVVESARAYEMSGQNTQILLEQTQMLRQTLLSFHESPTLTHLKAADQQIARIQDIFAEYAETALRESSWPRYQAALRYPDLPVVLRSRLLQESTFVPPLDERSNATPSAAGTIVGRASWWLLELKTFLQQAGVWDAAAPVATQTVDTSPSLNNWFASLADSINLAATGASATASTLSVRHLDYDSLTHELVLEVTAPADGALANMVGEQLFSLTNLQGQTRYLSIASRTALPKEGRWQLRGRPLFNWSANLPRAFSDSQLRHHRPPAQLFQQRLTLLTRSYWSGSHRRLRKTTLKAEQQFTKAFAIEAQRAKELRQQSVSERLPGTEGAVTTSGSQLEQYGSENTLNTMRRGPYTMQTTSILHVLPGRQTTHAFVIKPDPLLEIAADTRLVLSWFPGPEALSLSVRDHQSRQVPVEASGHHQLSIPLQSLRIGTDFAGEFVLSARRRAASSKEPPSTRKLAARIENTGTRSHWFPWPISLADSTSPAAEINLTLPDLGLRPDTLELLPNQTAPIRISVTNRKATTRPLRLEFDDGNQTTEITYVYNTETNGVQPVQRPDNLQIPISGEHLDLRLFDGNRLLDQRQLSIKQLDPWQCFRAEMTFAPDVGEIRAQLTNVHQGDIPLQTIAKLSQFNPNDPSTEATSLSATSEAVLSDERMRVHLNAMLTDPAHWQQSFAISVLGIPRAFRFYFPQQQLRAQPATSITVAVSATANHSVFAYRNGKHLLPLQLRVDAPNDVQVRMGIDLNRNDQIDNAELQLERVYFKGRQQQLALHATTSPEQWKVVSSMDDIQTDVDVTGLTGRCMVVVEAISGKETKRATIPLFLLKTGPPLKIIAPPPEYAHAAGTPLQMALEIPDGLEQIVDRLEYGIDRNGDGQLGPKETIKPAIGQPSQTVRKNSIVTIPTDGLPVGTITVLARTVALIPRPPKLPGEPPAANGPASPPTSSGPQQLRGPLFRRTLRLAETGTLSGTILLATGEPITNSYIRLNNGRSTRSDTQGQFEFRSLAPGNYRVAASRGLRRGTVEVTIQAGHTTATRIYLALP